MHDGRHGRLRHDAPRTARGDARDQGVLHEDLLRGGVGALDRWHQTRGDRLSGDGGGYLAHPSAARRGVQGIRHGLQDDRQRGRVRLSRMRAGGGDALPRVPRARLCRRRLEHVPPLRRVLLRGQDRVRDRRAREGYGGAVGEAPEAQGLGPPQASLLLRQRPGARWLGRAGLGEAGQDQQQGPSWRGAQACCRRQHRRVRGGGIVRARDGRASPRPARGPEASCGSPPGG
mmetsp:Transcript_9617/g.23423  ORF Transcript_9617/g.23423 Transcript_9617/m.23423 type:complete len:231 (-) Transcript_9617:947-1639(-)